MTQKSDKKPKRRRPSHQRLEFKEPKDSDPRKIQPWREPADDEEGGIQPFSVTAAWNALIHLPSCQQLLIKQSIQKNLNIVVGKNVTQEFPWKQVKFKLLQEHFFDALGELGDILRTALLGFNPEHHILMGYAPILIQHNESFVGDPFVIFLNPDDARVALGIIRNIEAFERWKYRKRLVKKPRRWITLGSENEVNVTIQRSVLPPIDVEVQSQYPKKFPPNKELSFRFCDDVRDGYVELLPNENIKWENVMRKRVTRAIQASPKVVHCSQQTTPTHPSNAWSQYQYQLREEDAILDETSEEEVDPEEVKKRHSERQSGAKMIEELVPKKKGMMEITDTILYLLKVIDFNQIDLYRNDYRLILKKPLKIFVNPKLHEKLSFANISRSFKRYVCSTDWYPKVSGLILVSYAFTTISTIEKATQWEDVVQRAVLESNPVLLWSFADNLNYKMELESPCEITIISFCPHDSSVIVGGASNGRIFVWDLQGRADRLEEVEVLTSSQAKYREIMTEYLAWAIPNNEDFVITAATNTAFEVSQKAPITGVYWMGNRFYINTFGKIYYDPDSKSPHKYFATCAMDTSISFWDLDATAEKRVKDRSRDMPKILTQSESVYKNRPLRPVFTLAHVEPLTGLIGDFSFSRIKVGEMKKKIRRRLINCKTTQQVTQPKETRMSTIASTFYGRIERLSWLGTYADADGHETANILTSFSRVHDGPIVCVRRSPFLSTVFVSIGRTVFAIWSESYGHSPLLWRQRTCDLTAVAWSEERPGILFFTRIDGNIEVWDILSRDDDAVLTDVIGGGIVTTVVEHKPDVPRKVLGIGDYNSSLRLIKLPKNFCHPKRKELLRFKEFARKAEKRKRRLQHWEQLFSQRHRDIVDARRQAEQDVRAEFDKRDEEERRKKEKGKVKEEPKKIPLWMYPYPTRMKLIWDRMNLNRMLAILMNRMRVNEVQLEIETRMEKRRLAFEIAKKRSLYAMRRVVHQEMLSMRYRVFPPEKKNIRRSEIIAEKLKDLLEINPHQYDDLAEKAEVRLKQYRSLSVIPYIEFFTRGEHRRKLLHKSCGGNTERKFWFKRVKGTELMDRCVYGYERFLHYGEEEEAGEEGEEEGMPEDGITNFPISEMSETADTADIYTPIK